MLVKMIKQTYIGKSLIPGTEHDLPADTAKRLISKGIAEPVEFFAPESLQENESELLNDEDESEDLKPDLSTFSNKELYTMCIEAGIEIEPKLAKAKYIEALEGLEE